MLEITPIGITNWRDTRQVFGIKGSDRLGHIYVIGKTGTGKSTLLANMAIADITSGKGLCVIDPHGDVAKLLLDYIPKERITDVIYFNATDTMHPIVFNPLAHIQQKDVALVTSNLVNTFKKIFAESWGPRLEHIMRYSILSLLHYPAATLLDIQPLLTDNFFRRKVLNHVSDDAVIQFWEGEFDKYPPQFKSEAIAPILNKTGILAALQPLRAILGQSLSSVSLEDVIKNKKILICNLSKGQIGEDAAAILGSFLVTAIQNAAFARAALPQQERQPFYLYIDEVHSFITLSFVDVLAEARKYGLSLFLAHQYLDQLNEKIRAAVFGNVGTLISFRIGAQDAKEIAQEFHGIFTEDDLINLPKYNMYLKLMIDGATSKPFSATTRPLTPSTTSHAHTIIAQSQATYGARHNTNMKEDNRSKKSQQQRLFE